MEQNREKNKKNTDKRIERNESGDRHRIERKGSTLLSAKIFLEEPTRGGVEEKDIEIRIEMEWKEGEKKKRVRSLSKEGG